MSDEFHQTSHTTKKHKRRQPIPGLTPDSLISTMRRAAKGAKAVRKVRRRSRRPHESFLPTTCETASSAVGETGLSGPGAGTQAEPLPDIARIGENGTQLSRVLRRMLGEMPPAALLNVPGLGRNATNAEMLAAIIMREALDGRPWAVEMVRDQTEGKPTRAAQVDNREPEIEDALDRASTAALNRLAKDEI